MILATHIVIAVFAVIMSLAAYAAANNTYLKASYGLLAGTIASGAVLVVASPVSLAHACVSGLAITATVTVLGIVTRRKLAAQEI
jgi:hypothetical protein